MHIGIIRLFYFGKIFTISLLHKRNFIFIMKNRLKISNYTSSLICWSKDCSWERQRWLLIIHPKRRIIQNVIYVCTSMFSCNIRPLPSASTLQWTTYEYFIREIKFFLFENKIRYFILLYDLTSNGFSPKS